MGGGGGSGAHNDGVKGSKSNRIIRHMAMAVPHGDKNGRATLVYY